MKKTLFTIIICFVAILQTYGNDTLNLSYPNTPDTLPEYATSNDLMDSTMLAHIDQALAWIDTTQCHCDTIIYTLSDSIYKARLQALPFIIEVPYNPVVGKYIHRYTKAPKRLATLRQVSDFYFPMFEDHFAQYDLPYELKYLAVVESALNPQARSHMGAVGLWQFMPSTGKKYGLEINSLVDERMDPVRSTDAACRFLNSLYAIFNDWTLAIAAYNCGPGNVNKAIRYAGNKKDFWSIYPYLPKETRNYVPLFIAVAYVMNYADAHGICPATSQFTMVTDTVVTFHRMHLKQIAEVLDIDINHIRRLNPQYARDIVPGGKAYTLCLPIDKTGQYIAATQQILEHRADELIHNRRAEIDLAHKTGLNGGYSINGVTYYKIKEGDNLGSIAKKFRCTVKQLKQWNGLKNDFIRAGKTLKILN